MIHVLCLNPAIDKLYEIDGFTAGEDYPGQRPRALIGGKGVNAARVLSQLDESVRLYAFIGETSMAAFKKEMEPRCACVFIPVPGACRTTINVIDRLSGRETVITEAGPQVSGGHVRALLEALEKSVAAGDMVVCSGSIIAGAPGDIYASVSRIAQARGARCAIDCNANALPASLEGARYALAKPNERELCALLGRERTQDAELLVRYARELDMIDTLLVSMGAGGGLLAGRGFAYLARVPQEEIISTVGSRDASLAGAVCALARGMTQKETLRLAMACGVANAVLGEVGSVRMQDIKRIAPNIEIDEIY